MVDDLYPNVYVGFSTQENEAPDGTGGTTADADFINSITDTVYQLERMVGLGGDVSGTIGHESRIKALEASHAAKITFATSAPSNPNLTDLWVDITGDPWVWNDWTGSTWKIMGANATQIVGINLDTTTPVNNQVLTYDSNIGKAAWKTAANAIGFANPMTQPNDLIFGGALGVATRFPTGTTGQYLAVSSTGLAWTTPPFVILPTGLNTGDVFYWNGVALTLLHGGSPNQFLKYNGTSPSWSDLPSSPPGSGIVAPGAPYIGAILEYDGTNWVVTPQGDAGQFWKSNGLGQRGSWAVPTSSGGFTNPMSVLGDIIIGDSGGAAVRLALGTSGQVLKVVGTAPAWADNIGFANPMTTTNDLILGGSSGVATRLAKGADGQVLIVDPTTHNVLWATLSSLTNPMTTPQDIIVGGTSGAPTRLAKGSNNTILGVDGSGNVVWRTLTAAGAMANPMTTKWDMVMADTGGTPLRLPLGGLGQVLTVVLGGGGNELAWATPSGGGGGGLSNPMTTAYDMILGGVGGTPVRLPVGTNGYVLTVDGSGHVNWAAQTGMTNPMTTPYDIIIGGTAGAPVRLAVGTNGYVLTIDGSGHVTWAAPTGGMTNPMTTQDDIIIGGAAGAAARLAKGTDSQVLTIDPSTHHVNWATPASPTTWLHSFAFA